jgi:hypothetical protein
MNPWITMLTGAGLGASVMYVLDPDHGARRRAKGEREGFCLDDGWRICVSRENSQAQ